MRAARSFACEPDSVRSARRFTVELLDGVDAEVVGAITLMVSELATNAIAHARTGFTVSVQRTARRVRIEVQDRGRATPTLRSPTTADLSGRGLRIVEQLAQKWGSQSTKDRGNNVWFTMDLGAVKPA